MFHENPRPSVMRDKCAAGKVPTGATMMILMLPSRAAKRTCRRCERRRPARASPPAQYLPGRLAALTMAPHMTAQELDRCLALRGTGKTPVEVHAALSRTRAARGAEGPDLTTVRRALRGVAHKRLLRQPRQAACGAARRRCRPARAGARRLGHGLRALTIPRAQRFPPRGQRRPGPYVLHSCRQLPASCRPVAG